MLRCPRSRIARFLGGQRGRKMSDQNLKSCCPDPQLQLVMTAARGLPPEKCSTFLERVAARLELRGDRFTTADLHSAIERALQGLIHSAA